MMPRRAFLSKKVKKLKILTKSLDKDFKIKKGHSKYEKPDNTSEFEVKKINLRLDPSSKQTNLTSFFKYQKDL